MRYTSKDMREKLASANQALANIGHPYRLYVESSYNTNFLERGTPEQVANHGGTLSVHGACGTPQQIANFIKVYVLGAYDQWQAKETLRQRAKDLLEAKESAWAMGLTKVETMGLDLQGVRLLVQQRAREQQEAREQLYKRAQAHSSVYAVGESVPGQRKGQE